MVRKYLIHSYNYFPQFFSIKQQLLSVIASLSSYFLAPKESNHSEYIHFMHLVAFLKLTEYNLSPVANIDTLSMLHRLLK